MPYGGIFGINLVNKKPYPYALITPSADYVAFCCTVVESWGKDTGSSVLSGSVLSGSLPVHYSTRAEPLSFRAIKDLATSHCTVGRKSGIQFKRSEIMPAGTSKRRLSECNLINRIFLVAKSLIARKYRGSARVAPS